MRKVLLLSFLAQLLLLTGCGSETRVVKDMGFYSIVEVDGQQYIQNKDIDGGIISYNCAVGVNEIPKTAVEAATTAARTYYKDAIFIKRINNKYWFIGNPASSVGQYWMFYVSPVEDGSWESCYPEQYPFGTCLENEEELNNE